MSGSAEPAASGRAPAWLEAPQGWWPPLRRREFWIVQGLVFAIAGGHALNEWGSLIELHGASFIPVSLYLLPVVYASLAFGIRGALPTAVWSFVLTIPNIVLWHGGMAALGELWQAVLVLFVGLFIGERVDRERVARRQAEARERERRASEIRYRGLFEMAADAVLVLDSEGRIIEANAAAAALLGRSRNSLAGTPLASISSELALALRPVPGHNREPVAIDRAPAAIWVQPIAVPFDEAGGEGRILVQLHDVTMTRERQHLVESFARDTIAAREEERRRVARDLHDGPLQTLMQLWRDLDALGAADGTGGKELLAEARARAEEAADELRQFSRDLRPSVLDDLGVASAMKAEAKAYAQRTGVPVNVLADGPSAARLPIEVELTLLRIFQEALRNVERHADARQVDAVLEIDDGGYCMQVADDGVGVGELPTPSQLVASGRLGVVGMQERARLIGATCVVRSGREGTIVEVTGRYMDQSANE